MNGGLHLGREVGEVREVFGLAAQRVSRAHTLGALDPCSTGRGGRCDGSLGLGAEGFPRVLLLYWSVVPHIPVPRPASAGAVAGVAVQGKGGRPPGARGVRVGVHVEAEVNAVGLLQRVADGRRLLQLVRVVPLVLQGVHDVAARLGLLQQGCLGGFGRTVVIVVERIVVVVVVV